MRLVKVGTPDALLYVTGSFFMDDEGLSRYYDGDGLKLAPAYESFLAAVTAAGTRPTTIVVEKQVDISADITIPTTIALIIERGGSFVIASGKTMTMNGYVESRVDSPFSGSGTVSWAAGNSLHSPSSTDIIAQTVGFTITGGTTAKTLTVDADFSCASLNTHKNTEDALNGLVSVNGAGAYSAKVIGTDVQAYDATLAALAAGNALDIETLANTYDKDLVAGVNDAYAASHRQTPSYDGDGIVATVAVGAGGTNYHVNDVLTLVGGNNDATVTVATLDGDGHVDAVSITTPGTGYTVSTQNCTGGHGTGFVADITAVDAGDGHLDTVGISNAGLGYHAGDVLAVAGGTDGTITADSVDGTGAVTGVTVTTGGTGYSVAAGLATTGGEGASCTIDVSTLTARTVARHNYLDLKNPTVAHGAEVTSACVMRFDANVGTHLALASPDVTAVTLGTGPVGANAGDPLGWVRINVNGTVRFIPYW